MTAETTPRAPAVNDLIGNFLDDAVDLAAALNRGPLGNDTDTDEARALAAQSNREWHPAAQGAAGRYLKKLMRTRWADRVLAIHGHGTLTLRIEATTRVGELRKLVLPLFEDRGDGDTQDENDVIEAAVAVWNSTLPQNDATTSDHALKMLTVLMNLKRRADPMQLFDIDSNEEILSTMRGMLKTAAEAHNRAERKAAKNQ